MSTAKRKESGYTKVDCRLQSYYRINFISGLYSVMRRPGHLKKFIYDISWGIANRNKYDELYQPIILRSSYNYKIHNDGLQISIPIRSINVSISSAINILSNALNWFLPNFVSNVSCVNTNIEIYITTRGKQQKPQVNECNRSIEDLFNEKCNKLTASKDKEIARLEKELADIQLHISRLKTDREAIRSNMYKKVQNLLEA